MARKRSRRRRILVYTLVVVIALVALLLALNEQILGALTWGRRRLEA